MKVILLSDVRGLGKKDQIVEASDGYVRNFLLPKKLAVVADAKSQNDLMGKKAAAQHKIDEERKAARETAEKLAKATVTITSAGGADGRLYGAVTAKDIADAISAAFGVSLDKRKIVLDAPIKNKGTYTVKIKLYEEISAQLTVVVTGA